MELFQLRVPAGAGRAFTPSRGSMVVLTHVALTCEGPKRASKDERITVQVATRGGGGDGKTDAIALGSVSDAPGREQFAIGGSGLCFGDGERVVVSHNGREAEVCLTGRVEATTASLGGDDSSDESEENSESNGEEDGESDDSESESDGEEDMMVKAKAMAKAAAAARRAEASDEDEDEGEDEDESESESESESEDSEQDDSDEEESESDDASDDDSSDDGSDDSDALPGSKRKDK